VSQESNSRDTNQQAHETTPFAPGEKHGQILRTKISSPENSIKELTNCYSALVKPRFHFGELLCNGKAQTVLYEKAKKHPVSFSLPWCKKRRRRMEKQKSLIDFPYSDITIFFTSDK
jgi:hypothetical protein